MNWIDLIESSAALIFVLCLIGISSLLLRKFADRTGLQSNKDSKINILEIKKIDQKNKIVLLEGEKSQLLILTSSDGNLLLEKNNKGNKDS